MAIRERRHDRIRTRLVVRYGIDNLDREDVAESISQGGLFINTNRIFKVGTQVLLQIEFPRRVVMNRGEVVWAIQVPEHEREQMICGMGVNFIDPAPEWPRAFREWIEQLRSEALAAAGAG